MVHLERLWLPSLEFGRNDRRSLAKVRASDAAPRSPTDETEYPFPWTGASGWMDP
jgi:hypothetical protein